MSPQPIVVKLGGDALATPARIAAQARRLARWAAAGPVVAVASARRGVTDHLLGLVAEIEAVIGDEDATSGAHLEADRAVASGEVVSAALLALALNRLGWHAVSLDAREAGILARGPRGDGRIRRIQVQKIRQLCEKGIIPVVTGFQGWQDGRVVTLGRGGSDTSAVALADALGASKVVFVKDAAGLRTADPKLVPDTEAIPEAPHAFLTALTRAGAKVVHAHAAALAEAEGPAARILDARRRGARQRRASRGAPHRAAPRRGGQPGARRDHGRHRPWRPGRRQVAGGGAARAGAAGVRRERAGAHRAAGGPPCHRPGGARRRGAAHRAPGGGTGRAAGGDSRPTGLLTASPLMRPCPAVPSAPCRGSGR
ncbi:MAG: hypothetical protein IPK12_10765 [Gemmatimonadetes bacterium]|nr:hypothetical protein [Gemmatimonadota bacterium]